MQSCNCVLGDIRNPEYDVPRKPATLGPHRIWWPDFLSAVRMLLFRGGFEGHSRQATATPDH